MTEKPDQAGELLALARDDLAIARLIDEAGLSAIGVGFHTQQAVEKALKAVLATAAVRFPFTHDLIALEKLCEESGHEPPPDLEGADSLSPYAAAIRYGLGDRTAVPSAEAIRWAAIAVDWAESTISAQGGAGAAGSHS